jgi:hypothetical protein
MVNESTSERTHDNEISSAGYLDLHGLEHYTSIPVSTMRDYIKREGLPCFKVRGKILVKRSEFDHWLDGYRVQSIEDLKAKARELVAKVIESDR